MNEDVYFLLKMGQFPVSHVSELRGVPPKPRCHTRCGVMLAQHAATSFTYVFIGTKAVPRATATAVARHASALG